MIWRMNGALDSVFIYINISLRCIIKGTYRESDSGSTDMSLLVLVRQFDHIYISGHIALYGSISRLWSKSCAMGFQ